MDNDVQTYIKTLKIKTTIIGGFDRESVYTSMQKLSSKYQERLDCLQREKEEYQEKYQATVNQLEQAKTAAQRFQFQLEESRENKGKSNLDFAALSQAVNSVKESRDTIEKFGGSLENMQSVLSKLLLEVDALLKNDLQQMSAEAETGHLPRPATGRDGKHGN